MSKKNFFYLNALFFLCLCLPYIFIIYGMSYGGNLFFLFPLGLSILLPVGALFLFLEKICFKPKTKANPLIATLSVIDIICGVLGWMLLLLVAVS
jgi:hypothetical protein